MTDVKKFFYTHPVFRYEAFSEFMIKRGVVAANSWRKSLQYHVRAGNLILIKRGLYAVLNPMTDKKTEYYIDPFLIAATAADDAVLVYHTALELHDIAYTTFETLTFQSKKYVRPFNFQSQQFQVVHPVGNLLKKGKENFAVDAVTRSGVQIKVTSLERTIVDVIDRPEISGGWEEIWRSLEHLVTFDMDKLIEYVVLLNKSSIAAKVGFVLDSLTTVQGIDKSKLKKLLPHLPKQLCYLERGKKKKGILVKKWHLVVPKKILDRKWEENYEADV